MIREHNKTLSCAFEFCDFYPLVNINPSGLIKYLGSFPVNRNHICIPFFLNDFIGFLESGSFVSEDRVIGTSLDVHRKNLTSYPISLIVNVKSLDDYNVDWVDPFMILKESISLTDIEIKSVVTFDYDTYKAVRDISFSNGIELNVDMDRYDKLLKSSDKKNKYKIKISKLDIDEYVLAISKKAALKSVLAKYWKEHKSKHYYKRKPAIYRASTYCKDPKIMNEVVFELSHSKVADASSAAGPDTSWTEGEPPSTKRDDYGSKFRDLPSTSWLGRKVRLRSINETAVDNDGVIVYDKDNIIKIKKSDGPIIRLRKNDPNLFFSIDLI